MRMVTAALGASAQILTPVPDPQDEVTRGRTV